MITTLWIVTDIITLITKITLILFVDQNYWSNNHMIFLNHEIECNDVMLIKQVHYFVIQDCYFIFRLPSALLFTGYLSFHKPGLCEHSAITQ
jgi:hypothetical protein